MAVQHVVIIGAGVMGCATACFLARDHGVQVTVIEREPGGARASSALSASSIRQQFSLPINIALSQWSLAFMQRVQPELAVPGHVPALGLVLPGYLFLASAAGAATLQAHHVVQSAAGVQVALLDPAALQQRFAWLNTAGLALASLGLAGEGWFDGPALWQAFHRKARACGARFIQCEAIGFDHLGQRVSAVRTRGGEGVAADAVVLCGGAWTAALADQLGVALPVSARKRDVFVLDSPATLPHCPLVVDTSGVWFRPEGRGFITGAPPRHGDPIEPALEDIDHGLFDDVIWPALAHRVPAFEALRVRSAWAGYYEMNDFDHNGLAGALPGWANAYTACGFSGHGMQQAPAVGSALAALVAGGASTAPALEPLSPQRLAGGQPAFEHNII